VIDSVSRGMLACASAFAGTQCAYPGRDGQADLTWVADCISRWLLVCRKSPIQVLTVDPA